MNSNRILEFSRPTISPRRWCVKDPVLLHIVDLHDRPASRWRRVAIRFGAQGGYFRFGSNTRIAHQRRCVKRTRNSIYFVDLKYPGASVLRTASQPEYRALSWNSFGDQILARCQIRRARRSNSPCRRMQTHFLEQVREASKSAIVNKSRLGFHCIRLGHCSTCTLSEVSTLVSLTGRDSRLGPACRLSRV